MAKKAIAVQGCTIAHDTGSGASGGTFTVTSVPSIKCKAGGNGIYKGTLAFTWAGGNYTGGVPGTGVASGTINFTATKTKADGQFVLRQDDTGTMNGTVGNPSGTPPTLPITSAPVKISNAGQTKVSGE